MTAAVMHCYLCGSTVGMTRDHIPPKGLFPRPRPSNLHTVPCCHSCNNRASKDDEYFRLSVSSLINRNAIGTKSWRRVVESTLSAQRISEWIRELRENVEPVLLRLPGSLTYGSRISVRADVVSRVLVRITKGFLYLTHPEIDRSALDFHITHIDQFKLDSIVISGVADKFTTYGMGEGVYRHWRALSSEDDRLGMWVHMFYDAAMWLVEHRPGCDQITIHGADGWE
jgi:hypothetical protein